MSSRLRDPAGPAGEAADIALGAAKIAKQAADSIPNPDPRDSDLFQMRASMEQIATRSSLPRRNRWKPLLEIDAKLSDLHARRAELALCVDNLDRTIAEQADRGRLALAEWVAAGEKGERPLPSTAAVEAERKTNAATLEAVDVAIDNTLAARVQHVEKHRATMVKQAEREVDATREKYLALVHQLRTIRADLVDARATATWAALFPHELATASPGNEANLALGLMKPVQQTLGVTHQLSAEQVLQGLEADANTIADRLTPDQRKELGTAAAPTPETDAMWHTDEAYQQWVKEQRERLNELARWTRPHGLRDLANEMADD